MWESRIDRLPQEGLRVRALRRGIPLSYAEVVRLWIDEEGFRDWFSRLLVGVPLGAYFWEVAPVVRSTLDRGFEFVLVDARSLLGLRPDPEPFAEQLAEVRLASGVAAFSNLGGDAFLVAPLPIGPLSAYAHLAAFVRSAPDQQRHALWRAVARAVEQRIGDDPLWVSTAGLGVPWLHVRLDTRPKYYRFAAYRNPPDTTASRPTSARERW